MDRRQNKDRRTRQCPKCGYHLFRRDIDYTVGTDKVKCQRDGCDWSIDRQRAEDMLWPQGKIVAANGY